MVSFELKKHYKKYFKSIFIAKFNFKNSVKIIKKSYINFVIKKQVNLKVFFMYLLITLMFDAVPTLLKSKKKKFDKLTFLGFKLTIPLVQFYKLVLIYLPILDIIYDYNLKPDNCTTKIIINGFPILYEVNKLCEINNIFVDYTYDYKMVLHFISSNKNYYMSECLLKFLKIFFNTKLA
jgi:hypothetical protein